MRRGVPGSALVVRAVASAMVLLVATAVLDAAANVRFLNLRDLVARADRIVRGTVVDSQESTIAVGGGQLAIVIYRIRVEEALKGSADAGDTIEVRLVSRSKQSAQGSRRTLPILRELPQFTVGRDYLFVLTRPSEIGLSTTVGLGQGLFQLRGRPGAEQAVNEANNVGLFSGIASAPQAPGSVAYAELVRQIRSALGR